MKKSKIVLSNNTVDSLVKSSLPKSYEREKTILTDKDKQNLNEKAVLIYLVVQKEKIEFEDTIEEEYIEKVIMFGYIVVFIFYIVFTDI